MKINLLHGFYPTKCPPHQICRYSSCRAHSGPLVTVSDSQKKLAQSAYEFITEIGFNDEGKTRMIEYNLQRPKEESPNP